MQPIQQNPFHILGITADASQRTIAKRKAKINAFQKVEREIVFDDDLILGDKPDRSAESINKALTEVDKNESKVRHALFWFVNNNHLDNTALEYLKDGNLNKASEIWEKTIKDKPVNEKNFTAYNNLSTLKLYQVFIGNDKYNTLFQDAIFHKTELINSPLFAEFTQLVADETYQADTQEELATFVSSLLSEVEAFNDRNDLINILSNSHPIIGDIVAQKITEGPINDLEWKIKETKQHRTKHPEKGLMLGANLYEKNTENLEVLKEHLGQEDLQYKSLCDNLANEILQCGINYFKEYEKDEDLHEEKAQQNDQFREFNFDGDLGNDVMQLFKTADTVAIGEQVKDRIAENKSGLESWIDQKPERAKRNKVKQEHDFILAEVEKLKNAQDELNIIEKTLLACKTKLQNIKNRLGKNDDLYLTLSEVVVSNTLDKVIQIINKAQEPEKPLSNVTIYNQASLKETVRYSLLIMSMLKDFDIKDKLRQDLDKNFNTLKNIASNLGISHSSTVNKKLVLFWASILLIIIALIIYSNSNTDFNNKNGVNEWPSSPNKENGVEKKFNSERSQPEKGSKTNTNSDKQINNNRYQGNQLKIGSSPYSDFFGKGVYSSHDKNWIEVSNGEEYDAVVCLVNYYSGETIRNEYIPADKSFKMTKVPDGTYYLKYFYGKDWNPNKRMANGKLTGGFETNAGFAKMDDKDDRLKVEDDGSQYSTVFVTLYTVQYGNIQQEKISETQFFER